MSAKPWLEHWEDDNRTRFIAIQDPTKIRPEFSRRTFCEVWDETASAEARAKLIAAAPAMARALCLVEYSNNDDIDMCPQCQRTEGHEAECEIDASLTGAGLDAAAREEVRRTQR